MPALAHSVAWAQWFGAKVTALHVVDSRIPPASMETDLELLMAAFVSVDRFGLPLFGSTTNHVLRRATRPVVTMRVRQHR